MGKVFVPGVTKTIISTGAVGEKLFVAGDGTLCGAGEKAAGVSMNAVTSSGKGIGVMLTGTALVIAGASVSAGDEVESDAAGKAITLTTGKLNGVAVDSAGAGEELEIKVV